MKELATVNPFLREKAFASKPLSEENAASIYGILTKTLILFSICLATALLFWDLVGKNVVGNVIHPILGWSFVLAPFLLLATLIPVLRKPEIARYLSPAIAVLLGIISGFLSGLASLGPIAEIVQQASFATFATLAVMLFFYCLRLLQISKRFVVNLARFFIMLPIIYMVDISRTVIFAKRMGIDYSFDLRSLLISAVVCVIAGCIFLVDLSLIENHLKQRASKKLEWYLAVSIVFDVIWLYVGLLFLIAIASRKRSNN
jgi:uncharacterized YccA/Bax inhibitor family protein